MPLRFTLLAVRRRYSTARGCAIVDPRLPPSGEVRSLEGLSVSGATQPRPKAGLRSRAFTLLELLAAIAIIAVLASLVIGVGRSAGEAGRVARTKAELAALSAALASYERIYGGFPQTNDGARLLQSLLGRRDPLDAAVAARSLIETARFSTAEARDPFADVSAVLVDPWGRPYRYAYRTEAPWNNAGYVLYSLGPDGLDSAGLLAGGFVDPTPPENADNLCANPN